MMRADNGVNWACITTMRATDTQCFVDNCDRRHDRFGEGDDFPAKQSSKTTNSFFAASNSSCPSIGASDPSANSRSCTERVLDPNMVVILSRPDSMLEHPAREGSPIPANPTIKNK